MTEETCVKLVLGIARLGEADLLGWWQSHGLTEAGKYVLGGTLPRTWVWTALEGAVLSAARRHEEALPRETAIHLFSHHLPVKDWALGWLRERKTDRSGESELEGMRQWTKDSACREIAQWAGVEPPPGEVLAGVRRLGLISRDDLQNPEQVERIVRCLAAAYVDRPVEFHCPYFDLT